MAPYDPGAVWNLRKELGLSQRGLANAIGVPQSTVYRWETKGSVPGAQHLGTLNDLALQSGIQPKWFSEPFGYEGK